MQISTLFKGRIIKNLPLLRERVKNFKDYSLLVFCITSIEELTTVIKEQEERMQQLFRKERMISRDLIINPEKVGTGAANIIIGPRRCGKSVFALQLVNKENFGYANFDDERLNIKANELNKVLEAIYTLKGNVELIVFDEIQEVLGWERFVSRLVDSKRLIITGSNAKMMSKELATYMTGRHVDTELLPFGFAEFLDYKGFKKETSSVYTTSEKAKVVSFLKEYLEIGGFPLGIKLGKGYLADLYRDIIQKDILQRHGVRMSEKLSALARYLIVGSASEISYNRLRNIFEIASKHTIQDWISYMEQAYILFKIERFSFKLKESIIAPKKIYAIDLGLMNMLVPEHDIGRTMETAVAIELIRRKSYLKLGVQINYWKNQRHNEVDFVIRHERKVLELIQVTYASTYTDINPREINRLLEASVELRCNKLRIITWDYEEKKRIEGKTIAFIPLWKWLLHKQ